MADKDVDLPRAALAPDALSFDTLDEAARHALTQAGQLSAADGREYAGACLRDALQKFSCTTPVAGTGDNFGYRLAMPKGSVMAGIYHNHPATDGDLAQRFSAEDVETIKKLGVPSYILAMNNGHMAHMSPAQAGRVRPRDIREGSSRALGDLLADLSKDVQPK